MIRTLVVILLVLLAVGSVSAQNTVNVNVIADEDSLTLSFPDDAAVSLVDLGVEVALADGTFTVYLLTEDADFDLPEDNTLEGPFCVQWVADSSTPPPAECDPDSTVASALASPDDRFWFDADTGAVRDLVLVRGSIFQGFCPAALNPCELVVTAAPPTQAAAGSAFGSLATATPGAADLDPEQVALAGVVTNADWEVYSPVVQTFSGFQMVLVPAGEFIMGSSPEELQIALELCNIADEQSACLPEWTQQEGPAHRRVIDTPFWLDQTEVTRAQYQECVDAGECSATPASDYSSLNAQPINRVTWAQAQNFCEWRGARLPTEIEWEWAARGPDRLRFPWGDEVTGSEGNHCDTNCPIIDPNRQTRWRDRDHNDGYVDTAPVGSYPNGASWVGALDMGGNVWEWTATEQIAYPYDDGMGTDDPAAEFRVVRGGSFDYIAGDMRGSARNFVPAFGFESYGVGFRCAQSVATR